MCCRFVFIDRRFGLNSLEGKDKYSETDGAAEKKKSILTATVFVAT